MLYGCRNGQVRIADRLEPFERFAYQFGRTAHADPAELHLRQADRLRQSSKAERQRTILRQRARDRRSPDWIIGEHFIGNHREAVLGSQPRHLGELVRRYDGAGRVVGADHDDRAHALAAERARYRVEVH